jgi:pimeloyl-ACP methyl ester carboxylesterase
LAAASRLGSPSSRCSASSYAASARASIPDARLVTIAGAAHLANYERAGEVNAAVEAWLGDYSLS